MRVIKLFEFDILVLEDLILILGKKNYYDKFSVDIVGIFL